MRVSSPALAAAFIDGAREQGTDVVDYGMLGTDVLYFAVVTDNLEGGAQITASHNPKQYNGIKMVRAEALPLSGDAGIGDIRDMIANDRLPAPAATPRRPDQPRRAARLRREGDVVHRSRRSSSRSTSSSTPAAAWPDCVAPTALRPAALPDHEAVLRDRRHVPQPRGQPADRGEPSRHHRGSDPAEGRHRHRLGRRRRPLLLHRRQRRVHLRRFRDRAAGRGVPAEASGRDDHLRPARQPRGEGHRRDATAAAR